MPLFFVRDEWAAAPPVYFTLIFTPTLLGFPPFLRELARLTIRVFDAFYRYIFISFLCETTKYR
jgi:hypothetical protein